MKQKVYFEIEETDIQKAFEKSISNIMEHELRAKIDTFLTAEMKNTLDKRVVSRVDQLVSDNLYYNDRITRLAKEKVEEFMTNSLANKFSDSFLEAFTERIEPQLKYTARSIIDKEVNALIKSTIEKEIIERTKQQLAILLNKIN